MIENNKEAIINKKSLIKKEKSRTIISLFIVIIIIYLIFIYHNLTNYLAFLIETKPPEGNIKKINAQEYV